MNSESWADGSIWRRGEKLFQLGISSYGMDGCIRDGWMGKSRCKRKLSVA